MTRVFSKFLDKATEKTGWQRTTITRTMMSAAVAAYVLKVVYPSLKQRYGSKPKELDEEEDELVAAAHLLQDKDDRNKRFSSPAVNKEFFISLKRLLKIMLPGIWSVEVGLLSAHTLTLMARTFISIYVAALEGRMVKFIVRRDLSNFIWMMVRWFSVAVPATFINSLIRYLEKRLSLAFRSRLVNYTYELYFKNQTYYRVSNLDSRIENADHRLTDEVTAFTDSVAHLYSHITKPILDIILVIAEIYRVIFHSIN